MKTRKITRNKVVSLILLVSMLISVLPQMGMPVWAIEETGYTEEGDLETTGPDSSTETQVEEEVDSETTGPDSSSTETQVEEEVDSETTGPDISTEIQVEEEGDLETTGSDSSTETQVAEVTVGEDKALPIVTMKTITTSNVTDQSVDLSWEPASDMVTETVYLQYKVIFSEENNINTVTDAVYNGITVQDWTYDLTFIEVTDLEPDTTYYFNVIVQDEVENKSIYSMKEQRTQTLQSGARAVLGGESGARAEFGGENGTELFLGGNFIELGISNWGDFGTMGNKPANFRGTKGGETNPHNGSDKVGMSADHDGFNNGRDLPIDYYLPGTPEERFVVGYKQGEVIRNNSNSAQMVDENMITTIENMSDTSKGLLKAKTVSKWADTMEITQVISFSTNDKFYRNEVILKNISDEAWDGARYMRTFDPDNTQFRGESYDTNNMVTHTIEEDNKAVVRAETYNDNDPLYKAFGTRAPIFFYSNNPRAVASIFGFSNTNPYEPSAYDTPHNKGVEIIADIAITITWDSGTLAPEESKTFVYYTSLDERDFGEVQGEIVIADIEKDIEDMEDMDDVKEIKNKIDNEKDLDEDKKDEFREILIGDVCDYPSRKDIPLRDKEDITIMGELIKESGKTEEEKDKNREKLVDKVLRDIEDLEDKEEEKQAIQDVVDEITDPTIKERAQSKIDNISSAHKYSITYDANGAEGAVPTDSEKYVEGSQVSVLGKDTLAKLGYNFMSWNTQADGKGISYKVNEKFSIDQDIILYAQWQKIAEVYEISAATGSLLDDISLSPASVTQYQDYVGILNVESGYKLPTSIIVTMGEKTLVAGIDYIYDKETGSLIVYDITEQITIKAKGSLILTTTYTLSFNTNGGSVVEAISGTYGKDITLTTPTKTGYSFAGWYRDSSFATSYTSTKVGKENITLYARWEQTTLVIRGNVIDEDAVMVDSATVKLMAGSRNVAEVTTDIDGKFTLTGVPAGTYNLVISKGDQTVTQVIKVSTGNVTVGTITLPKGNINSIVDVKPNTPDIIVDKLNKFFESNQFTQDDKNVVDSGGTVEIKLVVEKKDETGDNAADNVDNIKAKAGSAKEIGIFLDLAVSKLIKSEGSPAEDLVILRELENVIVLNIPLPTELQGKNNYVIYRYHGTEVQTINQTPNSDGEYIEVSGDKKTITLHTKKFSTYAIAYDPAIIPDNGGGSGDNGGSGGNSGGGGSSSKLPAITTEIQDGGKITISKDKKEATITPNEGYVIADVIVDGKSIGARTEYTFTNNENHKIQAVFVKKTALPYYMEDGKRVYIGFSVLANNHYNYIAPTGEIVEFIDNPKDFIDNTIPWAKPSIDFVTERELFFGTSENMFSPNEAMTRAMFVTVIGRLYERSYGHITGENTFLDVDQEAYYAKYVGWANDHGIIEGVGENKFAPKAMVTREQMASIIQKFAAFLNKADIPDRALAYTDSANISPWAIEGAKYCQETKVITGRDSGNFIPKGNATRAEVAAVIERFIKVIVK